MKHASGTESHAAMPRKWRLPLALMGAAVVGIVVISIWRRTSDGTVHPAALRSQHKDMQSGINYVGDAACSRCHAEIAETFRQHPMGRSLSPIATAPLKGDEAGARVLFQSQGLEYAVENRGGRLFHKETRHDSSGRLIAQNEAEVQFAVGFGRLGIAYLIERDGFLFQSPIAWYPQEGQWDLPPGYHNSNDHFERPVTPSCLFCHANRVEAVPGTINRYRPPIFHGHSIGCERCHGPGELHVSRPWPADGADPTIVNPRLLEPSLRDAVCEQCHLNAQWRVLRADRNDEDYRPGLPFYRFWTVLERAGESAKDDIVGQFEQMRESRCFVASQGRLGCISCHDPHRVPEPHDKVAYFKARCLSCHSSRGCSLQTSTPTAQVRRDNCTGCHMPRSSRSNTIHVASTNHRIPRWADGTGQPLIRAADRGASRSAVVNYHRDLMDDRERAEADRDIGVALCRAGPEGATVALPLLEEALIARPRDVIAWEAKGFALSLQRHDKEGFEAFRIALGLEPNREATLAGAAHLASRAGQLAEAVGYWRRAIDISPWRSDYRVQLAFTYFSLRDWRATIDACRAALTRNPVNLDVRKLLVRCYIRLNDRQAAREELKTLLGFELPDRDELLRQFAPLVRPD
jgi:Tfp pilus assembly protein PilF